MSPAQPTEEVPFSRAILKGFSLWSSSLGRVHFPIDLDQGTTLLVNTTLKFAATARLDGKLSVKAMNALQGPCFAFQSEAVVAASAELHFENCHNVVEAVPDEEEEEEEEASDAEAAEVDGGAMNVRGSLTVMGSLTIRDCSTEGHGGSLGSNYGSLSPGIDDGRPPKG